MELSLENFQNFESLNIFSSFSCCFPILLMSAPLTPPGLVASLANSLEPDEK